jgi:hypothetical protein
MAIKKKIREGLSDDAMSVDRDHEVQMARAQLYHLAQDAIRLHKLLKGISEEEGLEGWMQSKITLAADYIKSTADYLEYDRLSLGQMPTTVTGMPESMGGVSAGGIGAGSVAVATAPMGARKKTLMRR